MTLGDLGVVARNIRELRPAQKEALAWIADRKERFLIVNAPTGSGKSLIGRAAGAIMKSPAVYLASDLALQDQFVSEFPDARELKGRANYRPNGGGLLTCDDCDFEGGACSVCGVCTQDHEEGGHDRGRCLGCPYAISKRQALAAPFVALNTAYFLTEANQVGDFSRQSQLVVVDEADLLEDILLTQVGISLPQRRLHRLGLTRSASAGLETWAVEAQEQAAAIAQDEEREAKTDNPAEAAEHRREAQYWRNLASKLQVMTSELSVDRRSWVLVGSDADSIEVKPVFVRGHAHRLLWSHGKRFLLTSATLLAPEVYTKELGIPDGEWAALELSSTFPAENRRVHHLPVASMAYRHREDSLPKLVNAMDRILDHHPGRVLVHSQTFKIGRAVAERSRQRERMLPYGSGGRDVALDTFKSSTGSGRVLIGPSLKRGVDLPDDLCEAIVILVVPRPDWGDERVKARAKAPGGRAWYDAESVRQLCQMTGRGVRHEADHCETYILDSEFSSLLAHRRDMFPHWWLDAVTE
jgi:Rad3-related DNA helicase